MSEIQDAAQIIRVSFEGAEIILKMGNSSWNMVKEICAVLKSIFDQEKLSGKTSVQKLLKMGGDLQVFRFETKDMARVKELANKYGVLYSVLPDLNEKDGMSEILFHGQAAPRIESIMKKIENSNIGTLEDYYNNAEQDKLDAIVDEVKKPSMPGEKEYELVAREIAKKPGTKVSDVRSQLNMTWLQIWPIIRHMKEQGLLQSEKDGTVTMQMSPEKFDEFLDSQQWQQWFGKEEAQRRGADRKHESGGTYDEKQQMLQRIHREERDNPNVNAITIDRKLVTMETEQHIKARIPYRKNEFIWLDKSEIRWINGNKTIFTGLEKQKEYTILDMENRPVRKTTGQALYDASYDPVIRERARREQERIRKQKREKNHRQAQNALEAGRRTIQGQRR